MGTRSHGTKAAGAGPGKRCQRRDCAGSVISRPGTNVLVAAILLVALGLSPMGNFVQPASIGAQETLLLPSATPSGRYCTARSSVSAPARTSPRGMPCVTSMIGTSGAMRAITPWTTPTNSSSVPKSERKETGGIAGRNQCQQAGAEFLRHLGACLVDDGILVDDSVDTGQRFELSPVVAPVFAGAYQFLGDHDAHQPVPAVHTPYVRIQVLAVFHFQLEEFVQGRHILVPGFGRRFAEVLAGPLDLFQLEQDDPELLVHVHLPAIQLERGAERICRLF